MRTELLQFLAFCLHFFFLSSSALSLLLFQSLTFRQLKDFTNYLYQGEDNCWASYQSPYEYTHQSPYMEFCKEEYYPSIQISIHMYIIYLGNFYYVLCQPLKLHLVFPFVSYSISICVHSFILFYTIQSTLISLIILLWQLFHSLSYWFSLIVVLGLAFFI